MYDDFILFLFSVYLCVVVFFVVVVFLETLSLNVRTRRMHLGPVHDSIHRSVTLFVSVGISSVGMPEV